MNDFEWLIIRESGIVADNYLAIGRSVLSSNKDYAIGSSVAINGTRSRILKHRNIGYVGRVNRADALLHSIDKNERRRRVQRAGASDVVRETLGIRSARALHYLQARSCARKSLRSIGDWPGLSL